MTYYLIIALLGAVVVLLAVVLWRQKSLSDAQVRETERLLEDNARETAEALSDLRRENDARTETMKNAMSLSLNHMSGRIDDMGRRSSDQTVEVIKELSAMREKIDGYGREQTKTVTEAVEKLRESNEQKLEQMRLTVDEKLTATLTDRLDSSFKSVSEQLSNVYKSLGEMKELSGGVTALNRVFSNVKTRGNWAETQLENILDQIIPGMYVKNYSPEGSRDVVEFAVMIPDSEGGTNAYLPIDSKFPMEDYLRLCDAADAADPDGVRNARKTLEARVLAEAREMRKYICPPETTPFAILYLATDSLYAEMISSKENIADRLHSEYSVMLAGPSTITALLSSLAMGFRTVALNRRANEVMELLSAAKAQYDKFTFALEKARRKIDEAGQSLDDAQKRNGIILKKLKDVESVDGPAAESLLTDMP